MSQKRENFVRLAEARVSKAMQAIRVVGNLANRSNYEYSDDDVRRIVEALKGEIDALQGRFKKSDTRDRPSFKLPR